MAVTCTDVQIADSLRLGYSLEELSEAARLLALVSVVVVKHAPTAPNVIHNEAAIRLASYLYDQPTAPRGDGYANALRNSGAARLLLPYRVHRAGYADAMEAAQQAVGTTGNPVTGLTLAGNLLTVTFADVTTQEITFPETGVDATARAAAASALEAAAAKIDTEGAAALIAAHTQISNAHHIPPTVSGGGAISGNFLPGVAVAMRIGWSQTTDPIEDIFIRADNHPIDGANVGDSDGVVVPPFPPALNTDTSLYPWLWVAGDPSISELTQTNSNAGLRHYTSAGALTVDGVDGTAYVGTIRFFPPTPGQPSTISLLITGDAIASEPYVTGKTDPLGERIARLEASPGGAGGQTLVSQGTRNSQGSGFSFSPADRDAFKEAWNDGTYNNFLVLISYVPTAGITNYAQLHLVRSPSTLADLNSHVWEFTHGAWLSDAVTDVNLTLDLRGVGVLAVSGATSNTFAVGATCVIYGVR